MKIAVRYQAAQVDADGHVAGHDAGATLVRRLLRVFPGSQLIGPGPRHCEGFDVIPLEFVDGADTIVICMDVLDSTTVWQTLRASCDEPHLMNFVWWNTSQYDHPVQRAALALSCALFPTFANSERTASEVREIVSSLTTKPIADKAQISWVNLGIRLEHVQPRQEPQVPVVLYPAIYLSDRKQPQVFLDVVERIVKRTPIKVEARLHESHLISEKAMRLSRKDWAWVGPLTATREGYWEALARTTAFLATATEESYGLEYIEALVAGAVGVFPDRPWARAILPEGYPFFWSTPSQAEEMLYRAVTDTAACRREVDAAAGGSFAQWLKARHDDDLFDHAIVDRVHDWFGA
ncbi:glycosyltransferase family 1 protein [Actinotalea sp.]|uniref:glycosyltransferase family 1 protein n=1 Tax=Actinotalea sp. TaxID=1872145 RepID=UPI002C6738EC|nr:glycosyltransferase family 1 protein [Actinotalea sp.]HQY33153.1 glycosyltransferase family 1 protein [Actinotalea sp.]HRA51512.1 glycosyltransferase family 1 protein [Actinotalea sp.]